MQDTDKAVRAATRQDVIKISGTSAAQRRAWRDEAARTGMSLARWVREAADGATISGVTAADLRDEIVKLRAEIGRGVGNNLSQIARALNREARHGEATSLVPHEASLAAAARDLAELRRHSEALLRRVERSGRTRGSR